MKGLFNCSCCGLPVIVSEKHVGQAAICPRTKKRLLVGRKSQRPDPWWGVLCVTLLLFGGGLAAFSKRSSQATPAVETAARTAAIPVVEPKPIAKPQLIIAKVLPRETAPLPHRLAPVVVEVLPEPRKLPPEPRYQVRHEIPKRLDNLTAGDLEERLLAVAEVALDAEPNRKTSKALLAAQKAKKPSVGPLALGPTRPELAGLPYCMSNNTIPRQQAEKMESLALQLREAMKRHYPVVQTPISRQYPASSAFQPVGKLYAALSTHHDDEAVNPKGWATNDAVPCIRQMLQSENRDVRRMTCELLGDLESPEATAALVQWAVFDTDPDNRAAAINALRSRERRSVAEQLAKYLSYPWVPAVEHACEALVALGGTEAIPDLLAAKGKPDPDAPYELSLPHGTGGIFRQEMVRVNHARNCLLCHAVPTDTKEPLQAAIPDPAKPLPPQSTAAYYHSGGDLVAASTTYLRQDFSVMQPVAAPGPWPKQQRYDYLVAIRRELTSTAVSRPRAESRYQRAYDFALVGLGAAVPEVPASPDDRRLAETARFVSLQLHPESLHALKNSKPLLEQTASELEATTIASQYRHGPKASRVALVAYFAEAAETAAEPQREMAAKLLAEVRGTTADYDLPARLARTVRAATP